MAAPELVKIKIPDISEMVTGPRCTGEGLTTHFLNEYVAYASVAKIKPETLHNNRFVIAAWVSDTTGQIVRWEQQKVSPNNYLIRIFSEVSSVGSYGDGELQEAYVYMPKEQTVDRRGVTWTMRKVAPYVEDEDRIWYPYLNSFCLPLADIDHVLQLSSQ